MFDDTHRVLLDLNARGVVEGFRIDHPDGLADPEGYLARLRAATRPGTAIWVEKILEGDERLPADLGRATAPPATTRRPRSPPRWSTRPAREAITDAWVSVGGEPDLEARRATRQGATWSPSCSDPSGTGCSAGPREALPDARPGRLGEAIDVLLVAGDVYRAYVRPGAPTAPGRRRDPRAGPGPGAPRTRPDLASRAARG